MLSEYVFFNRAILNSVASQGQTVEKLHMFTDGAGSQFKKPFILSQVVNPSLIHKDLKLLDWSFFATAHGKGPVDGVGGTVKRAVWRRILQERANVQSAEQFAQCAQIACPNVCILYVKSQEVTDVRVELEVLWTRNEPRRIPSTHELHYVKANSDSYVDVSEISPFLHVPYSVPDRATTFQKDTDF